MPDKFEYLRTSPLSALNVSRQAIINAIADVAMQARAGTMSRLYQREWHWADRQNYVDAVDADEFNEAFHGIEREFDKLAGILVQGTQPIWQQEVTFENSITVSHNLGTTDLLVDLQAKIVIPGRTTDTRAGGKMAAAATLPGAEFWTNLAMGKMAAAAIRPGAELWTNLGNGVVYGYLLLDENNIVLGRASGENIPHSNLFPGDLTLRVRLWKLGE